MIIIFYLPVIMTSILLICHPPYKLFIPLVFFIMNSSNSYSILSALEYSISKDDFDISLIHTITSNIYNSIHHIHITSPNFHIYESHENNIPIKDAY